MSQLLPHLEGKVEENSMNKPTVVGGSQVGTVSTSVDVKIIVSSILDMSMNQVSATPGTSVLIEGVRQTIVLLLLFLFYLTCLLQHF